MSKFNHLFFDKLINIYNVFVYKCIKTICILDIKKVFLYNFLTQTFFIGNFCYSIYGVKIFDPDFNDDTARFCIGGAYGNFYSNYLSRINKNFIFMDIGSNIGIYSLIADKNIKCKKVIAFEPNIKIFKKLKKNIEGNINFKKRNTHSLNNVAISNKKEKKYLKLFKSSGSSKITNKRTPFTINIKTINNLDLKKLLKNNKEQIVIKIDVEGHEEIVVKQLLKAGIIKNASSIFVEVNNVRKKLNQISKLLSNFKLIKKIYSKNFKKADCLFIKN